MIESYNGSLGGMEILIGIGFLYAARTVVKAEKMTRYLAKEKPDEKLIQKTIKQDNLEGVLRIHVSGFESKKHNYFQGMLTDGINSINFEVYSDIFETSTGKAVAKEILHESERRGHQIIVQGVLDKNGRRNRALIINYIHGAGTDGRNYEIGKLFQE
jgi:hypothetical protein